MNDQSGTGDLWKGLRPETRAQLETRDYSKGDLGARLAGEGVNASELFDTAGLEGAWIPGVIVFPRQVFHQRSRGYFAELTRTSEGPLEKIGLVPTQWAAAVMYAESAKGFHIHPPAIPEGEDAEAWNRRLFLEQPENYSLRPYEREQWDVMFFPQGRVEMILVDERAGLERRVMRFVIDGDNLPGGNNAAVVIPPGVAHAVRSCSSVDLMMVYGTSTVFNPPFEGRIESGIENAPLPPDWQDYLGGSDNSAK